ncbi:hypothetical protein E2C01_054020 [Portunus trituberculatus]|uniref:Uncharacterized protein n=1 Tax=Portunus trituberculatus TaxID=210409 RepID=A0A5B7GQV2_PORTR|nr:hypothetical protein [Portunus trituberculatus]
MNVTKTALRMLRSKENGRLVVGLSTHHGGGAAAAGPAGAPLLPAWRWGDKGQGAREGKARGTTHGTTPYCHSRRVRSPLERRLPPPLCLKI